jgi:hypothetical protein
MNGQERDTRKYSCFIYLQVLRKVMISVNTPQLLPSKSFPIFQSPVILPLDAIKMLLGRKSKLPSHNKLLLYKAILEPIWTYGIQLW